MSSRVLVAVFALALAAPGGAARGQTPAPAPAPWALLNVRYDTRTSDFIYAAYGYGRAFALVGVLHNPRSGYGETLGGVGANFSLRGGPTQTVAVAAARATDAWYAQLYYLPAFHRGPLWVRATAEWYVPFDGAGTMQFALSPLSATVPVTSFLDAGVALDLSAARGEKTGSAIGPEVRIALPRAVLGVDAQRMLDERDGRLRISFVTSF